MLTTLCYLLSVTEQLECLVLVPLCFEASCRHADDNDDDIKKWVYVSFYREKRGYEIFYAYFVIVVTLGEILEMLSYYIHILEFPGLYTTQYYTTQ